ncbi:hypothetical protein [Ornithinimicrobium pratense]|uniref:Uncharacterized protein n=1 Tax=Ornithinimicrobium pratense TaxID=2593973 RepID=A0A5J6V8A3_9MICO|nr:hypothetical protein [Ornithinimicrobium pratense]QFG70035.1 hypothetical protein FY030_16135 [Ornithinimicrobium pratense]
MPWITLVLLAALVVGGAEVLREDRFAAEATLLAPTGLDADRASVALSDPGMVGAVEDEIELGPHVRGNLGLEVGQDDERLDVAVRATATDPRLAALAADTAVALILRDHPDVDYSVLSTATVPTEPLRPRTLWWAWLGVVALAGALWVEGAHRVWLRDHPATVPEGAR